VHDFPQLQRKSPFLLFKSLINQTPEPMKSLDKYDHMILDIIHMHKVENQCHIRLAVLERNFWKRIEEDTDLHVGKARIGERITNLYLDGLIQNKDGYALTKKGREQLALAPWKQEAVQG
tara:strand:- start:41 stop:400 length:360 start_codon:yes stop_codon:yes gene_type:complete